LKDFLAGKLRINKPMHAEQFTGHIYLQQPSTYLSSPSVEIIECLQRTQKWQLKKLMCSLLAAAKPAWP
jgi:hypothetical protein